jgi:hypothetical protein
LDGGFNGGTGKSFSVKGIGFAPKVFFGDRPIQQKKHRAIALLSEHNAELQDFFCEQLTFDSFIFIFKKPFLGCLIARVCDDKFIVSGGVENTTSSVLIAN